VALGARLPGDAVEPLHDEIRYANLGMRSFVLRGAGQPAGATPGEPAGANEGSRKEP
jgi:hypothetical protein